MLYPGWHYPASCLMEQNAAVLHQLRHGHRLVAGAGGLFRLPRAIGRNAAMELILTGEPLTAERAHQLGLVNRLVEPGEATAEDDDVCFFSPFRHPRRHPE